MIDRVTYERWTRIKDYPDYLISTFGRVKTFRNAKAKLDGGQILKGSYNTYGYWKVDLINIDGRKTVNVHRLVAMAFIPNPESKAQVNHIDGNKINNNVNNLEWNTQRENNEHSFDNGLQPRPRRAVLQFNKEGVLVGEFESVNEASRQTKTNLGSIPKSCNGERNHAGGYTWKYKND